MERAAADQRAGRRVHPPRHRHPRPGRAGGHLPPLRPGHRRGDPHRGAAVATTGRCATRTPTSTSTPVGTLNVLQNVREHCIDAPFIHCSTNKVYGDRPNTPAAGRAGHPVRAARRARLPRRHPRGHVDRRLPALRLRRLQGRRRRDGAGVRPLLRHEDRLLPGRHPDRPGALRHRAARLPRLRDALQHGAAHLQDLRVQGQDGPRRHPLARRGLRVRGVLPQPALGGRLQPRRRPALQHLPPGGLRPRRADHRRSR